MNVLFDALNSINYFLFGNATNIATFIITLVIIVTFFNVFIMATIFMMHIKYKAQNKLIIEERFKNDIHATDIQKSIEAGKLDMESFKKVFKTAIVLIVLNMIVSLTITMLYMIYR